MKKPVFLNGSFYHIYNRGTDRRDIFCNESDYLRFIYSMHKFNNLNISSNMQRFISHHEVRGLTSNVARLVDICYFALKPNHFHLTLQQKVEKGIERFMQKLGTGYTMYFNKKYERNGALFQGSYRAILIERESYLLQLSQYIHLNPLKLIEPEYREKGVKDLERAKDFLKNYRWSSYLDYIGIKNFPFLINNNIHYGYFKDHKEYEDFLMSGIKPPVRG